MAKRGENIYLRKDARWEGRYISGRRADGRAIFKSVYGKRYQEVRQKLAQCRSAYPCAPSASPTFEEEMETYLQYKIQPFVKPSTYASYRRMAQGALLPAFGKTPVGAIDALCIQRFICEAMKRYSPSTLRNIFGLLRAVLRNAVNEGRLTVRSWENARLPALERRSVRVLTIQEQRRLEAEARNTGHFEFILFLYTGLRLGELCALRREDVDCTNAVIHVSRSQYRVEKDIHSAREIGTPKTESSCRDIPLPPEFIPELERYLACSAKGSPYLFPGRKGRCIDSRTVQVRFARLAERIGIKDAHVHTLRHTYATRLLEQGVGIDVVSALLGHASAVITMRYYVHSTQTSCAASVARLHLSEP